jgi:hypothetical protein
VSASKWHVVNEKDNPYLCLWRKVKCFQIELFPQTVSFHIASGDTLTINVNTEDTFEQLGQKAMALHPKHFDGVLREHISFIGQRQRFSKDDRVLPCNHDLVCLVEGRQIDIAVQIGQPVKGFRVDSLETTKNICEKLRTLLGEPNIALSSGGMEIPETGLIAWWRFREPR